MKRYLAAIILTGITAGCGDVNAALQQLTTARGLSADLLVQFTKASDASNRAVMADTDELSRTFAGESAQATAAVQKDVDALGPLLQDLKYADETRLLQEFSSRFAQYQSLDRQILDLAVENTNLKAQRLSFGPGQTAVDQFRTALDHVIGAAGSDAWRVKATASEAVSAVREIQVLQSVHIADPDDAKMTEIETRMAAWQTVARNDLGTLTALTKGSAALTSASAALDAFMRVNADIVALSRRNTNVRSLALSLDAKRKVIAPCEESANALHAALMKHGYPAGR